MENPISLRDCLSVTGVDGPGKTMAVGGADQLLFKKSITEFYCYDVHELSINVFKLSKIDPLFDDCHIFDFSLLRGGTLAICLQKPKTGEIFVCEGYIDAQEKQVDISGSVHPTKIHAAKGKNVSLLNDEHGLVLISHPIRWHHNSHVELFHVSNFLQQRSGDKYTITLSSKDKCDATFGCSFISRNFLYLFYADDYSRFLLVPLAGAQCGRCQVRVSHGIPPNKDFMCKNVQVFDDFVLVYASMNTRRIKPNFYGMNLTNLKWMPMNLSLSHHFPKGKVALQKGNEEYVYLHGDCHEMGCQEKAHLYQISVEPIAQAVAPRLRSQSLNLTSCIPYPSVSTFTLSNLHRSSSMGSTPPTSPVIELPPLIIGKSNPPVVQRYKKKQSRDELLKKRYSANLKKSSSSSMDKCEADFATLKRTPSCSSVHWGADMAEQCGRSLQEQLRLADEMGYSEDVVIAALNMQNSDPNEPYQPFDSTNAMLDCLHKATGRLESPTKLKFSIFNGDSHPEREKENGRTQARSSSVSRSSSFHMGSPRPSRADNHDLFRLIKTLDREKERDKREVEQQFTRLKTRIHEIERERDTFRLEKEELQNEKEQWLVEQREKTDRIEKLEEEAKESADKYDRLTIEKMHLVKDLDDQKELTEHRRKKYEEENRQKNKELTDLEERCATLVTELARKSALLDEQVDYARRMEQRSTSLQSGTLLEQIAEQNGEMRRQQDASANTLARLDALYQQIANQLPELQTAKRDLESRLEEQKSRAKDESDTLRRELATLLEKSTAECCICLSTKPNVVFMPCRHLAVCGGCVEESCQMTECPTCRTKIEESMRIFT